MISGVKTTTRERSRMFRRKPGGTLPSIRPIERSRAICPRRSPAPASHQRLLPAVALLVAQRLHRVDRHDARIRVARQQVHRRGLEDQALSRSSAGDHADIFPLQRLAQGFFLMAVNPVGYSPRQEFPAGRGKGKSSTAKQLRRARLGRQHIDNFPMIGFKKIPKAHSTTFTKRNPPLMRLYTIVLQTDLLHRKCGEAETWRRIKLSTKARWFEDKRKKKIFNQEKHETHGRISARI